MTKNELSSFLEPLSEIEKNRWYKQQLALAHVLTAGLIKLSGGFPSSIEFPDPQEVVNATMMRILDQHSDRYIWDGVNPSTLNKFFARCMRTTLSSFRANERKHRSGGKILRARHACDSTPAQIFEQQQQDLQFPQKAKEILEANIAGTKIRGKTLVYLDRMDRYAKMQNTTAEIATDLDVKFESVDTFRKRVRALLPPSGGK